MPQTSRHTVYTPYAYGISTPLAYGIDIQETKRHRDRETCDGIETIRRNQQSLFALEGVKASPFSILMRRGRA